MIKNPKFNYRDVSKWRSVNLRTTKQIATMCSSGIDFRGCSKSLVFKTMAEDTHFYKNDADKFVHMMDKASIKIPQMKREQRYYVAKIKDVNRHLNIVEHETLLRLLKKVDNGRAEEGKHAMECVCVESDWDAYEYTWQLIEEEESTE